MNILSHIEPIVMTLTLPWPAETLILPVTIKPGYIGKVYLFKFNVTLVTENPADMGGYAGLNSADGLLGWNVNTLSGLLGSGSWLFEQECTIIPEFYEAGFNLLIAIGDTNYQPCVVTHYNFKLVPIGRPQYLPIMGIG